MGTAPEAARSPKLTDAEHQAVLDVDRGARALGLVGSDQPVTTVMVRDSTAAGVGPYARGQKVGVPSTNVIARSAASRSGLDVVPTDALYPFDVALHELGHVVQSQAMRAGGMAGMDARTDLGFLADDSKLTGPRAQEASGLREGLSDATSAVVTHDWTLGEDYFAPDSQVRAVRDVAHPTAPDVMSGIETDYRLARAGLDGTGPARHDVGGVEVSDVEGHSIGGIVSRATYEFEQREGWDRAAQLVATLQRDPALWREGGTLEAFRDRFLAAARPIDAAHPGALADARAALRAVGYAVDDADAGSAAAPPVVPVPEDPGPQQPGPEDHEPQGLVATARTMAVSGGVLGALGGVAGGLLGVISPLPVKGTAVAGALLGAGLGGTGGWIATR
jgi:hypothetical protein